MRRIVVLAVLWAAGAEGADLRGHGGPVRAIAVSRDGRQAVTGSFDSTVILWSLHRGAASTVWRFHRGAVNAIALLPDGRAASGGEDGRIALWRPGLAQPETVLEGHSAPVSALAVSPDGQRLASAGWDGSVRLWPLGGGAPQVLDDHRANVNGVGFLSGGGLVTASYDGQVRVFSAEGVLRQMLRSEAPVASLKVAPDDEIVLASADGRLRLARPGGAMETVEVADAPLAALALSPDGRLIAAAGFRGALVLVDRAARRVVRRMEGPAFPLWSLTFSGDGSEILTGGADRLVRRWSTATGEPVSPVVVEAEGDIPARLRSHPGAEVYRACAACHSLGPSSDNRAGPSLRGVMGRRIASLPGYDYSPEPKRLDIVWTADTLSKLFEMGPAAFTPGSKMPEQTVASREDRQALTDFLMAAQQ